MRNILPGGLIASFARFFKSILHETWVIAWELFRIIIPISIVTRVLQQLGVVDYIGHLIGPVMELVGLPGEMGLVWATTLVVNIYAGLMVFASLAPDLGLTVAQVTVITTMMLVAHALPVELRIAQKVGTRFRAMLVLRVGGAFVLGALLNLMYSATGTLQHTGNALWDPPAAGSTWISWLLSQGQSMLVIFAIIFSLVSLLAILKKLGISDLMTRLLEPVLRFLGMSRDVAPLAIIGMTLGISYGGGLLIREAQKGFLSKKDIFIALALMGLCHSIIEDTLVMLVFGAHLSGILWARLAFTLVAIFVLARLVNLVPKSFFERHLVRNDTVPANNADGVKCC